MSDEARGIVRNRIERADRIRPKVQMLVDEYTVRGVADMSGIPRTVIHDLIGGKTPQAKNLDRLEKWLREAGIGLEDPKTGAATDMLAEQIQQIIDGPGDLSEKRFLIAEVSAAYRAMAMYRAEEAARLRAMATLPTPISYESYDALVRSIERVSQEIRRLQSLERLQTGTEDMGRKKAGGAG